MEAQAAARRGSTSAEPPPSAGLSPAGGGPAPRRPQ